MIGEATVAELDPNNSRLVKLIDAILGYLHPRFRTPVFGIALIGIVVLAALFLT